MFKEPKPLAHLSFALVIIGLVLYSVSKYFPDQIPFLIGSSLVFYFVAFPFSVIAVMRNWRVPQEKRLDLWNSIEVGIGLLPFLIAIILVVYAIWFVR
ncbi:hypothetical protein J7L68_09105 [bacterium]|nr:hypothetical protein [bacterium]